MKGTKGYLVIISAILLLASCASDQPPLAQFKLPFDQFKPPSEGEARLTGIEMPDYVREDLAYDVTLIFDSGETPQVTKVCFRWLAEEISSVSPSLNCFAANGDFGTGNVCYTRTSVTPPGSATFCVEASDIKTDVPGRLLVRIRPTGLQAAYNKLEGQVEYLYNGQLRTTNSLKTTVTVDKGL